MKHDGLCERGPFNNDCRCGSRAYAKDPYPGLTTEPPEEGSGMQYTVALAQAFNEMGRRINDIHRSGS